MSENSKVVLKYKGEEDKVYDISNPDDLASFKQKAEKGRWYEKNEEDITKKLKRLDSLEGKAKIADNWETYLGQVRSGDIPIDDLYGKFDQMGIKLTREEKKEMRDDVYLEEDNDMIKQLEAKVSGLENQIKKNSESQITSQIENTFKALSKRYDGNNGYPPFDAEEVQELVKKKNLYMDSIEDTYENAYFILNREKILNAERENAQSKKKDLEQKRRSVSEDEPGNVGSFKFNEIDKKQSYNKLADAILSDMHKQGKSVFVED